MKNKKTTKLMTTHLSSISKMRNYLTKLLCIIDTEANSDNIELQISRFSKIIPMQIKLINTERELLDKQHTQESVNPKITPKKQNIHKNADILILNKQNKI